MRPTPSADRALRAAGWKPWFEGDVQLWMDRHGEGVRLTDEVLFIEWQASVKREAAEKERADSAFSSLVLMALGTTGILLLILALTFLQCYLQTHGTTP